MIIYTYDKNDLTYKEQEQEHEKEEETFKNVRDIT